MLVSYVISFIKIIMQQKDLCKFKCKEAACPLKGVYLCVRVRGVAVIEWQCLLRFHALICATPTHCSKFVEFNNLT